MNILICRFKREFNSESQLDYEKIKRQLFRIKNGNYPPIPKTVEDISTAFEVEEVRTMFGYTLDGTHSLYIGTSIEQRFAFSVFASKKIISLIEEFIPPKERRYLIDGTFKVVPRMFYQLIVISIEFENDVSIFGVSNLIGVWII